MMPAKKTGASKISDAALDAIKDANPCHQIAGDYVALRRHGRGFIGACPVCSKDLKSATATRFECDAHGWKCAVCPDGGDVIKLVQKAEGISFKKAIERLGGTRDVDPIEAKKLEAARLRKQEESAREAAEFRRREVERVEGIWHRAAPAAGSSAEAYLYKARGLSGLPLDRLRVIEQMPFYLDGKRDADAFHRGPALIAMIERAGKFSGIHTTYIDLQAPRGKLQLTHPDDGSALNARKVRGSKTGGHIVLASPAEPSRLILGEGIEKVGAVLLAVRDCYRGAAFWTCVDLGNLGGKSSASVTHPTLRDGNNRPRKVPGPAPDMKAPGIEIPASVAELVILADSTSDRFETLCAIARAVRRFERPGLTIRVAWPAAGADFDDMLLASGTAPIEAAIRAAAEVTPDALDAQIKAYEVASAARASAAQAIIRAGAAGETDDAGAAGDQSASDPADALDDPSFRDAGAFGPEPPPCDHPDAAGAGAASPRAANKSQLSQSGQLAKNSADRAAGGAPEAGKDWHAHDRLLAMFPQTDLGNAERFEKRLRGRLLYCGVLGWLVWDARRWTREGADGAASIAEHRVVRAIQDEADAIAGTSEDYLVEVKGTKAEPINVMLSDTLRAWGRQSENAARLNPISKRAAPYLEIEARDLDADRFKLNILNGTLVIRRRWDDPLPEGWKQVNKYIRLKPHDPADHITKLAPVTYDENATCPLYDQFLADVQPDEAVRQFLDLWDGYSLTGDDGEQRLVFHYGTGKNGKSTQTAIRLFVAGDYGRSIPIESFVDQGKARSAGQASPDLAMLRGARVVMTSEPEKGWRLNEGLIKSLTGGDEVPVRELHRPYFMLKPEFKLTMGGNYKPRIDGGDADSGIWRRVVLVPWHVKIAKEKRDGALGEKLKAEASGILNRWLGGIVDWLEHGLRLPAEVADATEQFRSDSDPLGRFLDDCTERDHRERAQATALYELFTAWARANGEVGRNDWTPTGFGRALADRGYEKLKSGVVFWRGLRIKEGVTVNDFVDHEGKPLQQKPGDPVGKPADAEKIEPDEVPI
jgi:putative DNA primase/helicase